MHNQPRSMKEALESPNTYVKPLTSAGAVVFIDRMLSKNPNLNQSIALGAGVGLAFLGVKLITPYLPVYQTSSFSTGAMEQRIMEVGGSVAVLAGLKSMKILDIPQFQDVFRAGGIQGELNTLLPIASTILIADIVGEGLLPFFGFDPNVHF